MPFNKKQMIEQAKFNYYLLGKAIEKQIKTIENQGDKQVKALNTLKSIKCNKSNYNKKSSTHKQNFDNLPRERIAKIYNISKENHFNSLTYNFKDSDLALIDLTGLRGTLTIYKEIKNCNGSIEKIEKEQK